MTRLRSIRRPTILAVACVACLAGSSLAAQTTAEWQDVIRSLRHPDAGRRVDSIERLAGGRYLPAVEPLAALLTDPDDRVQAAAIDAELSFFLAERVRGFRLFGFGDRSRAQSAFEAGPLARTATPAPPSLIDQLIAAMRDENARVRFDAVHALGFIAEPPLPAPQVAALAAELDHYDPVIRAATARVLGRLGAVDAAPALRMAIADTDAVVRRFAVEALGRLRATNARQAIRDWADIGREADAGVALLALARIGAPDDVPLFRQRLDDEAPGIRRAAAEGLGRAGDLASMAALERIAENDASAEVRLAAVFALQRLGQRRAPSIALGLAEDDPSQAAEYLGELGRDDAVAAIAGHLKTATDPDFQAVLVRMLGYVGTAAQLPLVEGLLQSGSEPVRAAAVVAIERLKQMP